jgi:hypothetical protein
MPTILHSPLLADVPATLSAPVAVTVEESPAAGRIVRLSLEAPGTLAFLDLTLRDAEALAAAITREIREVRDDVPRQVWVTLS